MPRVSFAFFAFAALSGLAGAIWGAYMGETQDQSTYLGHVHLNLIGWLGMGIMGTFYALAPGRVPGWLAWSNFTLEALGTILSALALTEIFGLGNQKFVPVVITGAMCTIFGMAAFVVAVLLAWRTEGHTAPPSG
jgi:hypothetical protein